MKAYKKTLITTSILTLFPILVGLLLWDRLGEMMITHWGFDGQPDGASSRATAVFLPPLLMLAGQWLCVALTVKDPKNQNRNRKAIGTTMWVIPIVCNLCCGAMYALALGVQLSAGAFLNGAMGLMFLVIGNYLPKCRQNYTMGIKLPWTFQSEENWNATHRFAGPVWMIGGVVILFSGLLPGAWGIWLMIAAIFALTLIPIGYSYCYYRRQKKAGVVFAPLAPSKPFGKWAAVVIAVMLIFVIATLFTGNIRTEFYENHFTIQASYYQDLSVMYDRVEGLEYHQENLDGVRTFGYGSFRLLMGQFRSDSLGDYTRYTYYRPGAYILMQVSGKPLVLSGKDPAETREIYETLLEKTGLGE